MDKKSLAKFSSLFPVSKYAKTELKFFLDMFLPYVTYGFELNIFIFKVRTSLRTSVIEAKRQKIDPGTEFLRQIFKLLKKNAILNLKTPFHGGEKRLPYLF